MPFTDASNRGITGHLAQSFDAMGQQQSPLTHTGSGERRFGPGVTASHYDYIECINECHMAPIWKGGNNTPDAIEWQRRGD